MSIGSVQELLWVKFGFFLLKLDRALTTLSGTAALACDTWARPLYRYVTSLRGCRAAIVATGDRARTCVEFEFARIVGNRQRRKFSKLVKVGWLVMTFYF